MLALDMILVLATSCVRYSECTHLKRLVVAVSPLPLRACLAGGDLMEYMRSQVIHWLHPSPQQMPHTGTKSQELGAMLQEGGKLQEQEAKRVFGQCVSALSFCQRKRICHRDLKPENILLDMQQNVKIADFGLASIVTPGSQLLQYCGTPAFSAPELFGKEHYEVNPSDVWSLGVVLYECLTGKLPFKGANQAALVKKICRCCAHARFMVLSKDCA